MGTRTRTDGPLKPYEALSAVYDAWTANNDYDAWADFIDARLRRHAPGAADLLDVCCGTGLLTARLQKRGYRVAGVDSSEGMLDKARGNVADGTRLVRADLPAAALPGGFDAAVCTFDSVNYMAGEDGLVQLLESVAAALSPTGVFLFDVNTRGKLENIFGDSHYGDDCGDFAYVWRNRHHPEQQSVDFLITLFLREGGAFTRYEEHHRQRWFSHEEIRAAADRAGFRVLEVLDDYTPAPATQDSFRETWVLAKPAAGTASP
ncbi:class I SAM-dependent DNA methyltransferase [Streptomyces sp. NBC_01477]|uniref:class I SAM-dependent DNA methyltransferase n=1 Tax=Streptomyces sp. NBC_01477 TaxID=2976015 RepID=UPI002E3039E0|nr:class I SAM-dependent methyltransferase [Streptomyces sp. NBC_01477]